MSTPASSNANSRQVAAPGQVLAYGSRVNRAADAFRIILYVRVAAPGQVLAYGFTVPGQILAYG